MSHKKFGFVINIDSRPCHDDRKKCSTTSNDYKYLLSLLYFASSFGGQNVSRVYDFQLFTFGRRNG